MVKVVTTYPDGDATITDCIKTFCEYWPKRYQMLAYYNADIPTLTERERKRVTFIQQESIPNMAGLMEALGKYPFKQENFLYNAWAWAQKALVIGHTGMMTEEPFIWIDSDVITHSDIPEDFIHRVLPPEIFMAIVGRSAMHIENIQPYTETGFLAFDGAHDVSRNFFAFYLNAWYTGAFKYLEGWTDCHVLDYTRHLLEVPTFDLTARLPMPCPGDHAFVFSKLGEYMDHLKGGRKGIGHSPEHPIKWWEKTKEAV